MGAFKVNSHWNWHQLTCVEEGKLFSLQDGHLYSTFIPKFIVLQRGYHHARRLQGLSSTKSVRLIDVSAKNVSNQWWESTLLRNKGGVVVKALAFHQSRFRVQIWRRRHMSECWVYCWFSPLLWEVFLPVSTQVFLSSQKPTRPNFS